MTKRELELENARLKGQIDVLERELAAARCSHITYAPTVAPPYLPTLPWYGSPRPAWADPSTTITCGLLT
jgi:hypothetical protein